jgi:YD repeat-containing protein
VVFSGGTSVREIENGVPTVDYVRGSDWGGGVGGILYTLRNGVSSFTHYNRRGDVTAKTDSAGKITYQAKYEAFGKRTSETGETLDRQKSNTKDEDIPGYANEGFRFRDLETGVFISKDPIGYVLMQPADKWFVDGNPVSQGEYLREVYPGTYADTDPAKSAKTTYEEKQGHVASSLDGNAAPGKLSHWHIAEPGQPNIYAYCLDNPWTKFDPEGLDAEDAGGGNYRFVVNPANFKVSSFADVQNMVDGQFVAHPKSNYTGQCAVGAQYLTGTKVDGKMHDSPATKINGTPNWTKGAAVSDKTKPGTMVAWGWDENGNYPNQPTGNHTAIYAGRDSKGRPLVMEQNWKDKQSPNGEYRTRLIKPGENFHEVNSKQKYDPRRSDSRVKDKK